MGHSKHSGEIPAGAGLIDLERVGTLDGERAARIGEIQKAMEQGLASDDDVFELCQLLADVGELDAVEGILGSADEGTVRADLFERLLPDRVREFSEAIEGFRVKYGLTWRTNRVPSVLQRVFVVLDSPIGIRSQDIVAWTLHRRGCEVDFRKESEIVADVGVADDRNMIPMVFRSHRWLIDTEHVGARWIVSPPK